MNTRKSPASIPILASCTVGPTSASMPARVVTNPARASRETAAFPSASARAPTSARRLAGRSAPCLAQRSSDSQPAVSSSCPSDYQPRIALRNSSSPSRSSLHTHHESFVAGETPTCKDTRKSPASTGVLASWPDGPTNASTPASVVANPVRASKGDVVSPSRRKVASLMRGPSCAAARSRHRRWGGVDLCVAFDVLGLL